MYDERAPRERVERTRSTTRQTRGGAGCCGCCSGLVVVGGVATFVGLGQLLGWSRDLLSGLDQDQRLGLAILGLLAIGALSVAAWRMRPRLRRTTTVVTRVSRQPRPAEDDEGEPLQLDVPLDAQWRPSDPGGDDPGDERADGAVDEQEGGA